MRRTWGWLVFTVAFAVVFGLALAAGCTQQGGGGGGGTKAKPIKVGAVVSVTGPAAPLGEGEKNTLQILVDKINEAGGINGRKLDLIIEDDASDPAKAQAAVSKLIEQDGVVAIIGGTTTPGTMSMIPETVKAGIPQISMAAGVPITNPLKPTVFRTAPSDKVAVEKVIGYLISQKFKTFAILHDSNAFGTSGADTLNAMAKTNGLKVTANEAYETAATDVSPQLNKIKGTNPDAVVVWGTNPGPAIAVKTMRELGMKQPFVGSHGIANMTFIDLAGEGKPPKDNPANGVVFPAGPILIPDSVKAGTPERNVLDSFMKDYEAKFSKKPNSFAGHAYDALGILVDALEKAGDDPKKLRDAIEQTQGFVGIGGVFTYTPQNHDALTTDNMILIKIENGAWTLLK